MWDPGQYGVCAQERSRPFADLLARLPAAAPETVVDLGCGSGELTASLVDRWPGAQVLGIDSSPEMLAEAARFARPGTLEFRLGAIEDWRPQRPVDVLVSNAALHWVPGHGELLGRLVAALAPGGWLAFQVPGNFSSPTHAILRELCQSACWRSRLGALPDRGQGALDPADYLDRLARHGCTVDAWETTYLHVLDGADPVLDWVRGTALRPVLAALSDDPAGTEDFLAEYGTRLRAAYPAAPYGTVLPFRRIFVIARRAS